MQNLNFEAIVKENGKSSFDQSTLISIIVFYVNATFESNCNGLRHCWDVDRATHYIYPPYLEETIYLFRHRQHIHKLKCKQSFISLTKEIRNEVGRRGETKKKWRRNEEIILISGKIINHSEEEEGEEEERMHIHTRTRPQVYCTCIYTHTHEHTGCI